MGASECRKFSGDIWGVTGEENGKTKLTLSICTLISSSKKNWPVCNSFPGSKVPLGKAVQLGKTLVWTWTARPV